MTTALDELSPVALSAAEVEDAQSALDAAEQKTEDLRAQAEELREAVRSGQRVSPKKIADAQTAAEHADLETEAARRRHDSAREAHHQALVDDALERQEALDAQGAGILPDQAAVAQHVANLAARVAAYNTQQVQLFNELKRLGVPGYTSSVARAHQLFLAKILARAISDGVGGDAGLQALRVEGSDGLRTAVYTTREGQ